MPDIQKFTKASLVADSLSLGPHWVYDQSKIAHAYPDGVFAFSDPTSQYHPKRRAGEFTHYGDQTLILSRSIEKRGGFALDGWREDWVQAMSGFDGYLDGASRDTLATEGASPSSSHDLSGAARIAPILDLGLPVEGAVKAAREQTYLTHGDKGVVEISEFFVRAVYAIESGLNFESAFERAVEEGSYEVIDPSRFILAAKQADTSAFRETASSLGQACSWEDAFPLTLYFALRPEASFAQTISDNNLAGGDTSARSMLLAVLFAARDGDVGGPLFDGLALS